MPTWAHCWRCGWIQAVCGSLDGVLPSRRALKSIILNKYEKERTKAKATMVRVEAASLTADMWTAINMDAFIAVTCHFVEDPVKLTTTLLGVVSFPKANTAANIRAATKSLIGEWGLEGKVTSIVTDALEPICFQNAKPETWTLLYAFFEFSCL